MNIGELFVSLGFDVDDVKLTQFNDKIKSVRNDLVGLGVVASGAVYALDSFMEKAGLKAVNLLNFSLQMGESTEAIQKWQAVIHQTNPAVSIDQAIDSYKTFARLVTTTQLGTNGSNILQALGVSAEAIRTHDYNKALQDIRKNINTSLKNYGPNIVSEYLDQVGIGRGALPALMTNDREFDRLASNGVISKRDLDSLAEFQQHIATVDEKWRQFTMHLAAKWAPYLEQQIDDIEKGLEKWIPIIGEIIKQLGGFKIILQAVFGFFAIKIIATLISSLVTLGGAFVTLGSIASAALLPVVTMLTPILAAIGLIAAPFILDKYTGWGQKFADFVAPVKPNAPDYLMRNGQIASSAPSVTQSITMHINGTKDPKETADQIINNLNLWNQHYRVPFSQFNLGTH